mgnify:CR=1 FL=1
MLVIYASLPDRFIFWRWLISLFDFSLTRFLLVYKLLFLYNNNYWSCGLMDKAPDFGSGDCRFGSCHDRNFFSHTWLRFMNYIRSRQHPVNIIFCFFHLPHLNGFCMLRKIIPKRRDIGSKWDRKWVFWILAPTTASGAMLTEKSF